ncbi:MFS transporter [Candidatus Omnitrophota bacterium]
MASAYRNVLKKRNFLLLLLGQVVSQFGDRLGLIALVALIHDRLGASSLGLAKTMFFALLPVFLINPLAGVYIDRWDKRKTMYISDSIRSLLLLALGLTIVYMRSLVPLYIMIFLAFCAGRFFIPAKMAIIPALVKEKEIFVANSLVSVTANIAAILGFGLGGILVERLGPRGGFIIDGFALMLSALLISAIRIKPHGSFSGHDLVDLGKDVVKVERSLINEFKDGLRYLFSRKSTLFSMKIFSLLFACVGALYVVLIVFIQKTFGTAVQDVGFFAVALGLGLFIGSLIYGKLADRFSLTRSIKVMLFISGLFLIIFVVGVKNSPNRFLGWVASFVLGGLIAPVVVGCNSLIHKKSADSYWGRIFSALEVVTHFSFVVFMFITSALAEVFSPFLIIVWVGIMISVVALIALLKKDDVTIKGI